MRNIPAAIASLRTRVFSTSIPVHSLRPPKYVVLAHKETRHPLWRLLDALRQPRHLLDLSEALHGNGISTNEYDRWKPLLHHPTIQSLPPDTLQRCPSWVVLHLIANKVRSSEHAHGLMLDLVYSHLDSAPNEVHGPLILLAAIQLARFNLVVPLRRLAQAFLHTWIEDPSVYFNLLLQVISCIPNRTVESANIAVLLLKAMESRQLKLTSETYEALLNDRFVTLQLTKYLQGRMAQEGFVPQTSHLEAYLRFFAKDGAIYDAKQYYNAIHKQETKPDDQASLLNPSSVPQIRANTLMLNAYTSAPPAFGFLRKLASAPSPTVITPPTPTNKKRKTRTLTRLMRTKFLSIHDLTAALCVAVRDSKCTSAHLIKIFNRAPGGRPTVATYTILIRGLLLRGDTVNAVAYWKKLLKSGATIDSEALATGVVALTRAGRPHDAFMLLERLGARSGTVVDDDSTKPKPVMLRKLVKVTQKTINDFMVALNRIHRPDVVFQIWDYMDLLYNVQPNALSLSILLQSARLAHKLDDTLSGALAHLSLKNPFRKTKIKSAGTSAPLDTTQRRAEAVSTIRTLLYDTMKNKPRAYCSGIWHDEAPADAARKVFLQALFGMAVEQEGGEEKVKEMMKLEAPASATRASVDEDPVGFGLKRLRAVKYVFEGFEDLLGEPLPDPNSVPTPVSIPSSGNITTNRHLEPSTRTRTRSHYPSILLTNTTFLNYILLLTLSSRSTEIPLLLTWMRYLSIQPSTSTLAVALAAWREVSVQAPLVERFQGGGMEGEGREYVKLVEWLKGWVGEGRIPRESVVGKWERILGRVREGGR